MSKNRTTNPIGAYRKKHKPIVLMDDDRVPVKDGDSIEFRYGIPPIRVIAPVIERNGKLIALTKGHDPSECNLRSLRRYVGSWYKQS